MSMISPTNVPVAQSSIQTRVAFLRYTYLHLAAAIGLFAAVSVLFYNAGVGRAILEFVAQNTAGWLLFIGGFAIVGYVARAMARTPRSEAIQYMGLIGYAVAEALIFSPMIFYAARVSPGAIQSAAWLTLAVFGGLSLYVLVSNKDFSFLRGAIVAGMMCALGIIVLGALFGFVPGIWFSGAMVLLACAAILFSTSNVLHRYPADQYVAASLELFAAVALLFWYILRIFMGSRR